ncbi:MAG: MBL fold metallo-hydrolase [Planctomycetota bacterium]
MSMRLIGPVYLVGGQDFNRVHLDWQANDANVYLVDTRDTFILVDCGCGESLPGILANVEDMGFDVEDISHVLLTHAHLPHAGGAGDLERMQVEVMASERAAAAVQEGDLRTASFTYGREFPPYDGEITVLEHGDKIGVGEVEMEVIALPGHSPGHLGFEMIEENTRLIFCGDVVRSPALTQRRDRFGYDVSTCVESLIKLMDRLPDVLYPGHGPFCLSDGQRWVEAELQKTLSPEEQ